MVQRKEVVIAVQPMYQQDAEQEKASQTFTILK